MFGWEEIAVQIATTYDEVSPKEQAGLLILTGNYGQAAAIDIYGTELGLPAAISGHNGYAFWDTEPALDPLIVIGYDQEWLQRNYSEVRQLGIVQGSDLFQNDETGKEIVYCRGLLTPRSLFWTSLRHFD